MFRSSYRLQSATLADEEVGRTKAQISTVPLPGLCFFLQGTRSSGELPIFRLPWEAWSQA